MWGKERNALGMEKGGKGERCQGKSAGFFPGRCVIHIFIFWFPSYLLNKMEFFYSRSITGPECLKDSNPLKQSTRRPENTEKNAMRKHQSKITHNVSAKSPGSEKLNFFS